LKISAKKVVFLILSEKYQTSAFLAPLGKILEKSPGAPPEKNLPTPMVTG